MRPTFAITLGLLGLAFALAAGPLAHAQPAAPRPWSGKLYADYGVNVLWPPGATVTESVMAPGESGSGTMRLTGRLPSGGLFRVVGQLIAASDRGSGAAELFRDAWTQGKDVVGLHELSLGAGRRAWQFDYLKDGRRHRMRLVAAAPRFLVVEAVSAPGGDLDPDTDEFLAGARLLPK